MQFEEFEKFSKLKFLVSKEIISPKLCDKEYQPAVFIRFKSHEKSYKNKKIIISIETEKQPFASRVF